MKSVKIGATIGGVGFLVAFLIVTIYGFGGQIAEIKAGTAINEERIINGRDDISEIKTDLKEIKNILREMGK